MQRVYFYHTLLDILPLSIIYISVREKGQKVDWAHIIFNGLCSELDWWYKYVEKI